jgi:hypothetical protein
MARPTGKYSNLEILKRRVNKTDFERMTDFLMGKQRKMGKLTPKGIKMDSGNYLATPKDSLN